MKVFMDTYMSGVVFFSLTSLFCTALYMPWVVNFSFYRKGAVKFSLSSAFCQVFSVNTHGIDECNINVRYYY